MNKISCLFALAMFVDLSAQSPLMTNLVPNNQGQEGGGLFFNLQVNSTVSISRIDSWVGTSSIFQGPLAMDVWLGPSTYVGNLTTPSLWARVATGFAAGRVPGSFQLLEFRFVTPIVLPPGNYAIGLKSQEAPGPGTVAWNHAYANGTSCTGPTSPGSCANTVHATTELIVRGGAAQDTFLSGPMIAPRMWSGTLFYGTPTAPIEVAAAAPFGFSCIGSGGLPQLYVQSQPISGQLFSFDVAYPPIGFSLGFWIAGLSNTVSNSVPLPQNLGTFGMPGCLQYIDVVAIASFGPFPNINMQIPAGVGLHGVRFFVQAALFDPIPGPGNRIGAVTTHAVAAVIGL